MNQMNCVLKLPFTKTKVIPIQSLYCSTTNHPNHHLHYSKAQIYSLLCFFIRYASFCIS